MSFSLLPSFKFQSVSEITPEFLAAQGIDLVLLDLDNTLIPYSTTAAEEPVLQWITALREHGVTLFIVSNSRRDRPAVFGKAHDIPFLQRAGKPSPKRVLEAMELCGRDRGRTALVGDQIYTDMIAASLAGVTGLLVEPIRFTSPLLAVRYLFELPFRRATGKKRGG